MQSEILRDMRFPITAANVLRRRRALKKELLTQPNLVPTRIAILGGSTTSEVTSMLELFLLAEGIQPTFYEAGYNRYAEDILFENPELWNFKPDVIFIYTTWHNVSQFPELMETEEEVELRIRREMARFESLWEKIHSELGALIIQNNFDLPRLRPLGNLETFESSGRLNFLMRLNAEFATYARRHSRFLINDILYLSAQVGLDAWHSHTYWYNFHMAVSPTATVALAQNVAAIVKSVYGRSKKCLVLDLDNTLWGGVVGDDGVQNLILGHDHPVGEAFLDFQRYVKDLQRRGVILAVCSKNDIENAKEGFSHPDSILKLDDFSAFKANWSSKSENIREIAAELNIGLDSIVFIDDNPAERAQVADQLPEVASPDVGSSVARFAEILESERYFEVHKVVRDDLNRSAYYNSNAQRSAYQADFRDHGEFLESLGMTAEIAPFSTMYFERITQLINKTNQFNLTTRRYTCAEVMAIAQDRTFVTLYGRLADRFGDNGLVSVLIGRAVKETLELDLWLMSCRVLGREMELTMFDALVEQCQARKIRRIVGIYIPSRKNIMVAGHYMNLGFTKVEGASETRQLWHYDVPQFYTQEARCIRRITNPAGASHDRELAADNVSDNSEILELDPFGEDLPLPQV
ncbi:HAD-IIIC family phosphatase [Tunturiibacter psychrotolerans]|uniref:HAD-IIIC family phosphatase n=1 Tax=Tunturiibacter psychrotolerans TaxID=3069686 RepID=UPI003D1C885A